MKRLIHWGSRSGGWFECENIEEDLPFVMGRFSAKDVQTLGYEPTTEINQWGARVYLR